MSYPQYNGQCQVENCQLCKAPQYNGQCNVVNCQLCKEMNFPKPPFPGTVRRDDGSGAVPNRLPPGVPPVQTGANGPNGSVGPVASSEASLNAQRYYDANRAVKILDILFQKRFESMTAAKPKTDNAGNESRFAEEYYKREAPIPKAVLAKRLSESVMSAADSIGNLQKNAFGLGNTKYDEAAAEQLDAQKRYEHSVATWKSEAKRREKKNYPDCTANHKVQSVVEAPKTVAMEKAENPEKAGIEKMKTLNIVLQEIHNSGNKELKEEMKQTTGVEFSQKDEEIRGLKEMITAQKEQTYRLQCAYRESQSLNWSLQSRVNDLMRMKWNMNAEMVEKKETEEEAENLKVENEKLQLIISQQKQELGDYKAKQQKLEENVKRSNGRIKSVKRACSSHIKRITKEFDAINGGLQLRNRRNAEEKEELEQRLEHNKQALLRLLEEEEKHVKINENNEEKFVLMKNDLTKKNLVIEQMKQGIYLHQAHVTVEQMELKASFKAEKDALNQEIQKLTDEKDQLRQQIQKLTDEQAQLRQENEKLEAKQQVQEKLLDKQDQLDQESQKLSDEQAKLLQELQKLKDEQDQLRQEYELNSENEMAAAAHKNEEDDGTYEKLKHKKRKYKLKYFLLKQQVQEDNENLEQLNDEDTDAFSKLSL